MGTDSAKFIDQYIGTPLIVFLSLCKLFKAKQQQEPKHILAISFWGIGSSVNNLPILKALKRKYPKATLSVLTPTKNADLFYKNKYVDNVILVDMNLFSVMNVIREVRGKFDIVSRQIIYSAFVSDNSLAPSYRVRENKKKPSC